MRDIAESIDYVVEVEECIDEPVDKPVDESIDEFLNEKNIKEETDNKLLNYALHYASIGYPVFPVHHLIRVNGDYRCSCRRWRKCTHQGKHPITKHGYKDATDDQSIIFSWWEDYPDANIGLVTGIETGIFVLDVDVDKGGLYWLEDLQEHYRVKFENAGREYEPLPATLKTITGSGGRHLYFRYDLRFPKLKGSASKIALGLDVRANGNYIIAPPSNHISGNKYVWFGTNTPIEAAPQWLMFEILKADQETEMGESSSGNSFSKPANGEKIKEGGRDEYLYRQACGLVRSFMKEEVLRRLLKKNAEDLEEPMSEAEVKRMVNWAWKNKR